MTNPLTLALSPMLPRLILIGCFSIPALFGAGAETFQAKCAMCHGADGAGATAMGKKFKLRDLRSAGVQGRTDDDLTGVISKGAPPMPAFGKTLTPDNVTSVVAYMRTLAVK